MGIKRKRFVFGWELEVEGGEVNISRLILSFPEIGARAIQLADLHISTTQTQVSILIYFPQVNKIAETFFNLVGGV